MHITFVRDEPVYRYAFRMRKRIPTRRQQRLAARRAGTANSIKKEWKQYAAQQLHPFSYKFFCALRGLSFVKNLDSGTMVTQELLDDDRALSELTEIYAIANDQPSTAG